MHLLVKNANAYLNHCLYKEWTWLSDLKSGAKALNLHPF